MEAPQHFYRLGHRFGRQKSGTEHAFAQPRDFAVFV
jgi:hypothetical protein